jgi:4-hydroxy-tetrahydrodipicolinate reductase
MKLALIGHGRMGRAVEEFALAAGHEVVARLRRDDVLDTSSLRGADVAVEFSVPQAAADNLVALARAGVDAVCGTTGWYDRLPRVAEAVESAGTGLVHAPNFSLGVALFARLAGEAARRVDALEEYDVFLHEAHHRHKLDHPSGTARALADEVLRAMTRKHRWQEGPPQAAPDEDTLWVSVTRAGEIPGTHVLGLEGPEDRIELRHEARGRGGFARGALEAARWIHGRVGVFTLEDFLSDRFGL